MRSFEPRAAGRVACVIIAASWALLGGGSGVPGVLVAGEAPAPPPCERVFQRGDVNRDLHVDIADVARILGRLFQGSAPLGCEDAADIDDDGHLAVGDAIYLANFLFLGGRAPATPFGVCGPDPTPDGLYCEVSSCPDSSDEPGRCGPCRTLCAAIVGPHVVETGCRDGVCVITKCVEGFYDIDRDPATGCEVEIPINGTPCNDHDPCTENDAYFQGVCGGFERDCSHLDDECFIGRCEDGECIQVPRPANTPCDDGDPGTRADRCDGRGNCRGVPIP